MKKLLLILCIGLLFACGDNASGDVSTTEGQFNKQVQGFDYYDITEQHAGSKYKNYLLNPPLIAPECEGIDCIAPKYEVLAKFRKIWRMDILKRIHYDRFDSTQKELYQKLGLDSFSDGTNFFTKKRKSNGLIKKVGWEYERYGNRTDFGLSFNESGRLIEKFILIDKDKALSIKFFVDGDSDKHLLRSIGQSVYSADKGWEKEGVYLYYKGGLLRGKVIRKAGKEVSSVCWDEDGNKIECY
jgi:hypothetical protein